MTRAQLEHLIRAAAELAEDDEIEPHDLVIAKAAAGRERDRAFVREAIRHRLVDESTLRDRLAATAIAPAVVARVQAWFAADFALPGAH